MDWYYECESGDFLVPKYQEDLLERHPSPESWSEWGINAPEGFDSPQDYLIMDTNETEVEFDFIDESFSNEIEFDPSLYKKDQSSSSSACGGLPEQSFQQAALSSDHQPEYQLQDLSTFEQTDNIFLDSVLEDFPHVESLNKSFFYPENQCRNMNGGEQRDIAASGFVPCNSDSKDCLDIEAHEVKVSDPFEQSNRDEAMVEQLSQDEFTLQSFEMMIGQFNEKTRICFRDALYRLARNTKQLVVEEDLDGDVNMHQEMEESVYKETMRSEDKISMESETNSVDRAVANLMFNKIGNNILDLPFTALVNLKQEVFGSKGLQGKSSKALNVTKKSHSPHLEKLPADAEVPRFGLEDQQEATESYISY